MALWARVDVLWRPPFDWFDARAHLVHRSAGEFAHLHGNAVVAVFRMAAAVSIDAVPHMQQFLTDNHLERFWLGQIDAPKIDEN